MVRGISTDSKKYKHKKRNDEKWLSKDLKDIKKTTEKYIDDIRTKEKGETKKSIEKKKEFDFNRVMAILILGIFGAISLVFGISMIYIGNYLFGLPTVAIGVIFIITFYLYEKYRFRFIPFI